MHERATHGLRAEIGRMLRLAGPIIASQLGQTGMNTADTIQVGPLGATALASAGIGSAIHHVTVFIGAGILVGISPLVSQSFGARRFDDCRDIARQGFWLALLVAIPVAFVSFSGPAVALLFGQEATVAELAGDYLVALGPGVPAILLFLAVRQYIEAMGHTAPAMIISLFGLVLNVGLNHLLIHGVGPIEALGVVGAGYATSIVRWVMCVALLLWVVRHRELDPIRGAPPGAWRIDAARIGRIFRIGAPIGAQFGLEVGLFAFAAVMMGWFGPVEVASHQVTISIASTTFMVALGTSMAGSIRVGQTIGAGNVHDMRSAIIASYLLAVGFMGFCALVFVAAPDFLIGLYTNDPDIIVMGGQLLLVAAAFQVFDGGQVAGITVLRGAGDTMTPAWIAAAGYWGVGMLCALGLGFATPLGPVGIWIGLCAGLAAVAVTLGVRVYRTLWLADPASLVEQPQLHP